MLKTSVANQAVPVTDVYTNVQGLQQLGKNVGRDEALKKVAQQFESMFIHMMLKNMRQANAVFEEDSLFNSKEGNFYRDMHDHQLSLTLAHNQGVGIADVLYRQLSRNYGEAGHGEESFGKEGHGESENQMFNPYPLFNSAPSDKPVAERVAIADSPRSFVDKVMPYVKKAAKALGVEAEMLAAQAALETGWGKHMLANNEGGASNNLFNIKRDSSWQGDSVAVNSLEEKEGVLQPERAEFKSYGNLAESVSDYIDLISNKTHFRDALDAAENSFDFIQRLQKAGYATDSGYAEKIFSVYRQIKQLSGAE